MARELGYVDVDAMLSQISSSQLTEWLGFFIAEREARDRASQGLTNDPEANLRAVFGRPK